ncbi:MAG: HEAT repeat domain-containing protein [bacterium]
MSEAVDSMLGGGLDALRDLATSAVADLTGGELKGGEVAGAEQAVAVVLGTAVAASVRNLQADGLSDDEIRIDFVPRLLRLVECRSVWQELVRPLLELDPDSMPDAAVLGRAWNETFAAEGPALPEGFKWSRLSEAHARSTRRTPELAAALRPVAELIRRRQLLETEGRGSAVDAAFDLARYRARLRDRYRFFPLDRLAPVDPDGEGPRFLLEQVFVEPEVRPDPPGTGPAESIESRLAAVGELPGEDGAPGRPGELRHEHRPEPAQPLWEVLAAPSSSRLVVLGDPGSGKSLLGRYLAWALCSPELPPELRALAGRTPFVIELSRLAAFSARADSAGFGFVDYLDRLGHADNYPLQKPELEEWLRSGGPAVFVFDGLDEVFDPGTRADIERRICALDYPGARVIVTSRAIGYRRAGFDRAGFAHCVLQDLDRPRIERFCRRWYATTLAEDTVRGELRRQRLLRAVDDSPEIRALAGNPMLLTLLAMTPRRSELPRRRHQVLERAVRALVEHWHADSHVRKVVPGTPVLDFDDKLDLLRAAALLAQERRAAARGNFITGQDLENEFARVFESGRLRLDRDDAVSAARALVERLETGNSILRGCGMQTFGFADRTFLDCLCADHYARRLKEIEGYGLSGLAREVLELRVTDELWHEVIRLLAGMAGDDRGTAIAAHVARAALLNGNADASARLALLAVECLAEVRDPGGDRDNVESVLQGYERLLFTHAAPGDPAPCSRATAALAAANLHWQDWNLFKRWEKLLVHEAHGVRRFAQAAAAAVHRTDPEALSLLKQQAAEGGDENVRWSALEVLAGNCPTYPGVPELLKQFVAGGANASARWSAYQALAGQYPADPDIPQLLKQLAAEGRDEAVRWSALRSLADKCPDDPDVAELLKQLAAEDPSPAVRGSALRTLAGKHADAPGLTELLRRLADEDASVAVRGCALRALADRCPDDPGVLALLKRLATEGEGDYLRRSALEALAARYPDYPGVLALLKQLAVDGETSYLRRSALELLAGNYLDSSGVLTLLKQLAAGDKDEVVRWSALRALAGQRPADPDVPSLMKQLATAAADETIRWSALRPLARKQPDDPDVLPLLRRLATEARDEAVRWSALRALSELQPDDPDVLPLLRRLATEARDEAVRWSALRALAEQRPADPGVLPLVKRLATEGRNEMVRACALTALLEQRPSDPDILPLLKRLAAGSEGWFLRASALRALALARFDDAEVRALLGLALSSVPAPSAPASGPTVERTPCLGCLLPSLPASGLTIDAPSGRPILETQVTPNHPGI